MSVLSLGRSAVGKVAQRVGIRLVWARFVQWQFRLFHRHRHRQLVLEHVQGRPFVVLPDVFNPQLFKTGAFLATTLDSRLIPPGARVLDMGTGSGVGAVFAASWTKHVTAIDINEEAVRCARINVLLNRVEDRIVVRYGDLFAPVAGERFDVVLFNPPFFRGNPEDEFDYAWRSTDIVERFAAGLHHHLTPTGYALVLLSTVGDTETFLQTFEEHGFEIDVVAERNAFIETFTVYRLDRRRKINDA